MSNGIRINRKRKDATRYGLFNTGVQFAPDVAMILKESGVIYKCGCRGEVQCIPNTKKNL